MKHSTLQINLMRLWNDRKLRSPHPHMTEEINILEIFLVVIHDLK